jgi:phospholipid/cholesterol/gamma-HCH transport system substrate-binding protein
METRARFVLLGFFTLAVIFAGFGFVYWLNYGGTSGEQTAYRIRFQDTVSGLRPGSAVLFNGIRVGEVKSLRLEPASRARSRRRLPSSEILPFAATRGSRFIRKA